MDNGHQPLIDAGGGTGSGVPPVAEVLRFVTEFNQNAQIFVPLALEVVLRAMLAFSQAQNAQVAANKAAIQTSLNQKDIAWLKGQLAELIGKTGSGAGSSIDTHAGDPDRQGYMNSEAKYGD